MKTFILAILTAAPILAQAAESPFFLSCTPKAQDENYSNIVEHVEVRGSLNAEDLALTFFQTGKKSGASKTVSMEKDGNFHVGKKTGNLYFNWGEDPDSQLTLTPKSVDEAALKVGSVLDGNLMFSEDFGFAVTCEVKKND